MYIRLTAPLDLCLMNHKLLVKKFEVNRTKIKAGCQLYTKAAPQQSWSDLTLARNLFRRIIAKARFLSLYSTTYLILCYVQVHYFKNE